MNKILKSGLLLSLLLMVMSCSKEELPGNGEEVNGEALTINVVDKGYASQDSVPGTKATTDGRYLTKFGEGDAIGVYVVSDDNKILVSNAQLTYSGGSWSGDITYKTNEAGEAKFFAYYPYDASVSVEKLTTSASDAEVFFATYLSGITLPTDQSDAGKYSKADIMVGDGVLAGTALTFGMEHQMGLVVMEIPTGSQTEKIALSTDPNYHWDKTSGQQINISSHTFSLGETPITAYEFEAGVYRFLIKPGTTDDLNGTYGDGSSNNRNFTIANGKYPSKSSYKKFIVDGGKDGWIVDTHTLAFGDFFMSDGSILKGSDYLSGKTIPNPGNCVGIVFSTTSPYSQDNTLDSKFTHGLVMALKDASTSAQWKTSNDVDESLTNCTTLENCRDDLSGYSNSNHIWTTYSSSLDTYPAFGSAKNYVALSSDETYTSTIKNKTSGWFLPSIGQWIDILANLGKKSFKEGTSESITNTSGDIYITDAAESAASSIDAYLNKVGSSYVDLIGWSGSSFQLFWTSSEYSSSGARSVYFNYNGNLALGYNSKNSNYRLRCVLAF